MRNIFCLTLITVLSLLFVLKTHAQDPADFHLMRTINTDWKFHRGGMAFANRSGQKGYPEGVDTDWETVSIPHTWNADDPFDEKPSYARGIGWYRKYVTFDSSCLGKRVFLEFEGANQRTEVYLNGAFVGQHKGGYTGFTFDITEFIRIGTENLIAVMVDNSHNNTIAPLSVGFALYGGIYRDVRLVQKNPVHFSKTHYGSSGIYISTPEVSARQASIRISAIIENTSNKSQSVEVKHTILDSYGKAVLKIQGERMLRAKEGPQMIDIHGSVMEPDLWSPEAPVLYRVISQLYREDTLVDRVNSPIGFRWFDVDPATGFSLNGRKYMLRGTNRHQDYEGLGSALSDSLHIKDLEWIKNMGANFLRLAHYPQDPVILNTADTLGLLVWVEAPNVNYIVPSKEMTRNSGTQLKEMIYQGFNHPSVVFWGSSNEIFLWDKTAERKSSIDDPDYRNMVREFVSVMDSIIKVTDPGRISTLAIHGSKDYDRAGITEIPEMVAVNHYSGWYGGTFSGFGNYLDSRHRRYPQQVLFVSEYGAGGDVRVNTTSPKRFDFSGQYQQMFHKSYLKQINEREYLAGSAIWSQFDFSQPHTGGSIYHLNQKGMQRWDRIPKDAYYLYKANWNPEPMVYIASRDWDNRSGWNGKAKHDLLLNTQRVNVYSNMGPVELFHNGISLGTKQPDELKEAVWDVPFTSGANTLKAVAGKGAERVEDVLVIEYKRYNLDFSETEELAVNVGFNCEFEENPASVWLPDQEYVENHYGHNDGESNMVHKDVILKGAKGKEALFNYCIEGLSSYKADIPDGSYRVELFFAEGEILESGARVFDVFINGEMVLEDLDLFGQYGFGMAVEMDFNAEVTGGDGLTLDFRAKSGDPLLSGIRLKRIN